MDQATHNKIVSFIWGIADDVLRDLFKRGKYPDVILPMCVLRRMDAVLEPTKKAVLETKQMLDRAEITEQRAALAAAAGQSFYNTSKFTLRDLKSRGSQQQLLADFEDYLNGFSQNVQDILENFKFRNQLSTLSKSDSLGTLINKFLDPEINLSPDPVLNADRSVKHPGMDNHSRGTVFEELVRKFNEENNEEAGEHWTPRDAVRLMANLIFLPVAKEIKSGSYLLYDGAAGTGGMLTVAEETLRKLATARDQQITTHLYAQEINPETYAICKADNAGSGTASLTWNNTPLTITSIFVPSPPQTNGPVLTVDVAFSTAIDPTTFTYQDVTLTRDTMAVNLDATVTTSFVSGNTYRIGGLGTFTSSPGTYFITVNTSGIIDLFGRAGTGTKTNTWKNIPFQITVTVLGGSSHDSAALGVAGSQQVGYANIGFGDPYVTNHAALWSSTPGSFVDLGPVGSRYAAAFATSGSQQVGSAGSPPHAALWSGTAGSFKDLNPGSESVLYATSGSQQAGYAGIGGAGHAGIWSGTAASFVDLHPAVASDSFIYATTGSKQAGRATIAGNIHAALWSGTKTSFVDLNPAGASRSWAYAAIGSQQAGFVDFHAALWSGTSNSFVDLNPVGWGSSEIRAMSGSRQAGSVGNSHAALWSGTASSFVDLHYALGSSYSRSQAFGVSVSGGNIYVVGTAGTDAVLWTIRDMVIYVDRAYAGANPDGSLQAPFKTVTTGYQAAKTGDSIRVFIGNYPESITLNKSLRIEATNGVVNIGR